MEGFTDSEGNVIDFAVDEAVDVAGTVVHAVMVDRLKAVLPHMRRSRGRQAMNDILRVTRKTTISGPRPA